MESISRSLLQYKDKNEVIIYGYCRQIFCKTIPREIIQMVLSFAIIQLIVWDENNCSKSVVVDNGTGIVSSVNVDCFKYVTSKNVITTGIHVLRFKVLKEPQGHNIIAGICDVDAIMNGSSFSFGSGFGYYCTGTFYLSRGTHKICEIGVWKENDIITIIVDMNNYTISWKRNDIQDADKIGYEINENKKYKWVIHTYYSSSQYQLIDE